VLTVIGAIVPLPAVGVIPGQATIAAPAAEHHPCPDGLSHQGVQQPLLIRLRPVRLCRGDDLGGREPAVNDADTSADIRAGRGQRMPADADFLQRRHSIGPRLLAREAVSSGELDAIEQRPVGTPRAQAN
jgi:hypothetical protein